ncbi:hypothetical protein P153DRAFT_402048 [Dothidotthia symphoricarpi CBS 119687]|uniref:FabD/lysophospholipase-like protein n=1 Tax=Dothidotthia symphoricarpi CBS 119687 TaxID=1392245 RepID=A0A6A6AU58_9PLEO|nr:uncharacterized protein P153DRAFT_402048 [Dothidotthia symphoricarpi CBS 119687]KAF2134377.1 hypothetical protein P153DRAFT_402048 [Dothidotthia symphoricarpi CBS 119687]
MANSMYRKPPDLPLSVRPPSYTAEIPVIRTSRSDMFRNAGQRGGSASASISRDTSTKVHSKTTLPSPRDHQETNFEDTQLQVCDDCKLEKSPIWDCSYCGMSFCDQCWDEQGPHQSGRTGPDGLPHEKANPTIVKRLKNILTPPQAHGEQQTLHVEDEDTTWFGLARDNQNRPIFQDYGRYSAIMADSNSGEYKLRYPQLVSFIGQTGAGKSTLIKMLIDQQERKHRPSDWNFPSPVAGSLSNGSVPTSGDVHLYSDPSTYAAEYPMLYADCEGLEGGESIPMAMQYRNSASTPSKEKGKDNHPVREHRKRRRVTKSLHSRQIDIKWANSPDKLKRQYAVTELYPRLLYTFSDVIVFVLRNPKTFESTVLSLLITWASSSIEKSLNQPTLPHAVIALNATDTKVDQQEWDPEHATKLLMSNVSDAVNRNPTYCELREYWTNQGKPIRTMEDLLKCYYSSVTVVRIPGEGRYMMIDEQVKKLHDVVSKRCTESFNAKRKSRMLSNSDALNVYLQCAFDHFAQDLHTPFNFMDISFKINPIPLDFGGNILKLAVAMKSQYNDPTRIFQELSFMVSSCILLDIARQSLKGPTEQLLKKQYLYHCDSALDDFCAIFWPCTFRNKRDDRCVNFKERHTKGHQNQRGNIIGTGPYESGFTFNNFADSWLRYLLDSLSGFQKDLSSKLITSKSADEIVITTKLHHANVNNFYHHVGGAQKFVSHTTCFCCLRELAEHPLPCGHVLCAPCIKGYGKPHSELSGSYTIAFCPLHEYDTVFPAPWEIYFKPPLAGVRVLSLDGGGMRGIVILEVLRQVQEELGGRIPIQDFFDLVVGTSTGGILALGLGIKNWSVNHCISLFLRLVEKAFTPKFLGGVSFGTTKFRTQPLEEALSECFGDEAIFGGVPEASVGCARKVAVTAATDTGEQAVIFTNYNRVDDEQIGYQLVRPDDPKNDLMIREAARATSAAPTFFKPFRNTRTMEGFLDGAVFHNNPVRIANYESKLLWPEAEERHPDILLSIGTGRHEDDTDGFLHGTRSDRRRLQVRDQTKPTTQDRRFIPGLRAFNEVEGWLNIFKKRVESVLDAELTWKEFRKDVVGTSSPVAAERYIRINPTTKSRTPKMDDKTQIHILRNEIKSDLRTRGMQMNIEKIAHRLVASSFYFEKSGPSRDAGDHIIIQGTLQCRFAAGSDNLRNLGDYIRKHQRPHFQPFFQVQEVKHNQSAQKIYITAHIVHEMIDRGLFHLDSIVMPVTSEASLLSIDLHLTDDRRKRHVCYGFPISGFPRSLADGEPLKRTASITSPNPERPKIANKRHSLREKLNAKSRISLDRPVSDSNITYALHNEATTAQNNSLGVVLPETPEDITDWARRRIETSRCPPKPVQVSVDYEVRRIPQPFPDEQLHEVDAGPALPLDEDDEALVYAFTLSQKDDILPVPRTMSETDADLARALERSQHDMRPSPRRTTTGTDEDELAKVLSLSLHVR